MTLVSLECQQINRTKIVENRYVTGMNDCFLRNDTAVVGTPVISTFQRYQYRRERTKSDLRLYFGPMFIHRNNHSSKVDSWPDVGKK
jgi:hypothetical protein